MAALAATSNGIAYGAYQHGKQGVKYQQTGELPPEVQHYKEQKEGWLQLAIQVGYACAGDAWHEM